jgi:glycosyltransferase involved in cell wall biosynthesis
MNLELFIVDDASTDATSETVMALKDDRVRYVVHEERRGGPAARNTGVLMAQGEFIAFLDSDDEWLPDKLERQLKVFEANPRLGLVYGGWQWIREDTKVVQIRRVPDKKSGLIDGLPRWHFNHVNDFLIRAELMRQTLYNEGADVEPIEHRDLLVRLAQLCEFGYVSDVVTINYNHAGARASNQQEHRHIPIKALERLIWTQHSFMSSHPGAWAESNFRLGRAKLKFLYDTRGARPYLWASIRAAPYRPWTWVYALASLAPAPIIHPLIRAANYVAAKV